METTPQTLMDNSNRKKDKGIKYLEKIIVGIILVAAVGFLVMIIAMAIIFSGAARR